MNPRSACWLCLYAFLVGGLWLIADSIASDKESLPKDVPSLIKLLRDKNPRSWLWRQIAWATCEIRRLQRLQNWLRC